MGVQVPLRPQALKDSGDSEDGVLSQLGAQRVHHLGEFLHGGAGEGVRHGEQLRIGRRLFALWSCTPQTAWPTHWSLTVPVPAYTKIQDCQMVGLLLCTCLLLCRCVVLRPHWLSLSCPLTVLCLPTMKYGHYGAT